MNIRISLAILSLGASVLAYAQTRNYEIVFPSFSPSPTILAEDVSNWNYTESIEYNPPLAGLPAPLLVVRGQSSSSDHALYNHGKVNAYELITLNGGHRDFGFHLLNLDFRDVEKGRDVVVSYRFRILASDPSDTINPIGWAVKYALNTNSEAAGVNYTETAQHFSFADDGSRWTDVVGSFSIPAGKGGARGALLINAGTSGTGFSYAGRLYLADLSVSVAASGSTPKKP